MYILSLAGRQGLLKESKTETRERLLGMCVEITTSVLYLQYVASEVVLHPVSYSIKKVLSDWMSGWMKRDGVLSSFHFNVFRISV